MRQFDALADTRVEDQVIANHVAAAQACIPTSVAVRSPTMPEASMANVILVSEASSLTDDLGQPFGGAAGGIFFKR